MRKVLQAKVFFERGGQPTMVRYYRDSPVVSFT
jgi:hypothetical protein